MKIETRSDYVQVRHWLLDKTDFLLAVKVIGSGGFKAGAARGKTKKGTPLMTSSYSANRDKHFW